MVINFNGFLEAFRALLFDFLPYAEGTSELRQNVLALDFNLLHNYSCYTLGFYLTIIKKLVGNSYT